MSARLRIALLAAAACLVATGAPVAQPASLDASSPSAGEQCKAASKAKKKKTKKQQRRVRNCRTVTSPPAPAPVLPQFLDCEALAWSPNFPSAHWPCR